MYRSGPKKKQDLSTLYILYRYRIRTHPETILYANLSLIRGKKLLLSILFASFRLLVVTVVIASNLLLLYILLPAYVAIILWIMNVIIFPYYYLVAICRWHRFYSNLIPQIKKNIDYGTACIAIFAYVAACFNC
jgi:hypothetical protein